MKKIGIGTFMLIGVFTSGAAFAYSCPRDMNEIDQALTDSPSLSMDQLNEVKALRAKGEKMHKRGDHSGSTKALEEAKDMLGI